MNQIIDIGHNNPPDPIDEAVAPFSDFITEAENWLDGGKVEDEAQMKAVDALTKQIKAALKAATDGEKSAAAPLHDAWKAEKARWKPTIEDLTLIRNGLVDAVASFKKKLADQKAAEQREAWNAAEKARREAEVRVARAAETDIEAQREAREAQQAAMDAEIAAKVMAKDTVKGMRKVTKYEITDMREALHWIARNDKASVEEFVTEYVRRNHKTSAIAGVRVWTEKEAF